MTPDELLELSQRLSAERLFIQTERDILEQLNHDVSVSAAELCQTAWIVRQQKLNLLRLSQEGGASCCQRANLLGNTKFVKAHQHLDHHEFAFSKFLKLLRDEPDVVAEFLCLHRQKSNISSIIDIFMSAVYGGCTSTYDETQVAQLLVKTCDLLMANNDTPASQLLTKDRCMWCQVYRTYVDCLPSCRLFLTAALYQPVIDMLSRDEWYFDIDPSKALERFPPGRRLAKFGQPGTETFQSKVKAYRKYIIKTLYDFTMKFVESLKDAFVCFPFTLKWLVANVNRILKSTGRYDSVRDPMNYGLTADVTVSRIARHNLMQVARILQVLSKAQSSDEAQRIPDLYSMFPPDCLISVIDDVLNIVDIDSLSLTRPNQFTRSAFFIGTDQLNTLTQQIKETVTTLPDNSLLKQRVEPALKSLPNLQLATSDKDKSSALSTPTHSPSIKPKKKSTRKLPDVDSLDDLGPCTQDVIKIDIYDDTEPIGLMEEEKVLASEDSRETNARLDGAMKKTRFYIAQDQESIGNVSEYQASELADAISEAASVRSERSTNLDDGEDVDDNLSDMVSANVSGKGSPNISGRETPQSVDEGGGGGDSNPSNLPVTVPKPDGDLTERFGKFDIAPPVSHSMDVRSLVSDSWSVDVNPSDTENLESQQEPPLLPGIISETASESAWSVDVLNSDTSERQTDRLKELEQIDDTFTSLDHESESDRMSTRSTDSRRGEPSSPLFPLRQNSMSSNPSFQFSQQAFSLTTSSESSRNDLDRLIQLPNNSMLGNQTSGYGNSQRVQSPTTFSSVFNRPPSSLLTNPQQNTSTIPVLTPQPVSVSPQLGANKVNVLDLFDPLADSKGAAHQNSNPIQSSWLAATTNNSMGAEPLKPTPAFSTPSAFTPGSQTRNWPSSLVSSDSGVVWGSQSDQSQDPWSMRATDSAVGSSQSSTPQPPAADTDEWSNVPVRPKTWSNTSSSNPRVTTTVANRYAIIGEDAEELEERCRTWASPSYLGGTSNSTANQLVSSSGITVTNITLSTPTANSRNMVLSVTPSVGQGTIPKKFASRSTASDEDNIVLPGRKLGKERKSNPINVLIKKSKRGKSYNLKADRASPAISEGREDVNSSASDDSGKLSKSEKTDVTENSEEILEKYRNQSKPPNPTNSSASLGASSINLQDEELVEVPSAPIYDEENLEKCLAFSDAKKKLRIVLSMSSLSSLLLLSSYKDQLLTQLHTSGSSNFLVVYLRILYSEAISQDNVQLITQLQETIRCLQRFNNTGCYKLMKALRVEYQSRVHFISYLAKSRQRLLNMQTKLKGVKDALERDHDRCFQSLILECVRMFMDRQESRLSKLSEDFLKLQSPDDKVDEIEKTLSVLYAEIDRDDMWYHASDLMRDSAQLAIERNLMERIYDSAMFPNEDADTQRDRIFQRGMSKLSTVITPSHRELRIPAIYHLESPWSSAQAHLSKMNAFKAPRDKVKCICRCADTILRLLRLAHTKSVPGADDFFPVFVYVIIMANPPFLLSTIQFVESLYESKMEGEESYNWNQFKAAVSFTKKLLQEETIHDDSLESTNL